MICKHCGESIKSIGGRLWHSDGLVFPQYCRNECNADGSVKKYGELHEPLAAVVTINA